MNLLVRRGVIHARANWGRWVGDCPSPFCASALQLSAEQPWFRCRDCDATAEIVWPVQPGDIERLLMMRPDETTRNWEPGETLHDLIEQNLAHGILPWDLDAVASRGSGSLVLGKDRIVTGEQLADRQLTTGVR